jgi:hypothetical protein
MKKFAAFAALCVAVTGAVFADLAVRGSAYAYWDTFQYVEPADGSGPLMLTGIGRPGGSRVQANLDFTGQLENRMAGFRMQLSYEAGSTTMSATMPYGENIFLWVRPFDWMRIDVGKIKADDLIKLPVWFTPVFDSFLLATGKDQDIFSNFEANNASVLLRLTPVRNLFIGAFLYNQAPLNQGENAIAKPLFGNEEVKYAFQRIQAAASYAIPDVGTARFQYYGLNPDINDGTSISSGSSSTSIARYDLIRAPRLEAAFAYTGIRDLTIDLGGKFVFRLEDPEIPAARSGHYATIPTMAGVETVTVRGIFQAPQQASLGARYELKNLGPGTLILQGRGDTKFWGYYQLPNHNITRMGPEIKMSLWPAYRINNTTFGAETTLVYSGDWTSYGRMVLTGGFGYSFGGYVQQNFAGGCSIAVGITCIGGEGLVLDNNNTATAAYGYAVKSTATEAGKLPLVISIPVKFSVYF